jgi:coenzyme F420-reducing hydrogenase alpha subunit
MARRRSSMKVKQLIKIAEAVNGKLPADMYELDEVEHHSYHRDEPIRIADMDVVYLVRAFRHQERMLNRQVGVTDTALKIAKERDRWKEKAMNMVEKHSFNKVKDALAELNRQPTVKAEAYDVAWKRIQTLEKRAEMWKKEYEKATSKKGCNYVFSEIPNDTEGQEFVDTMKKYLNKDSYKMRVRGQHIKEELKGTGATYWGQGLNESSHMRVYVDVK